jgi:RHS repeat-associated protein
VNLPDVGTPGDGGDQYAGLDRFGRVVDQLWTNTGTSTTTDEFQYGYDAVGNRLYRNNTVNTAFGELYTYDALNQLATFQRGTLNSTKTGLTGSASASQSFSTDAVGNFTSVTTNGTAQTRSANAQNQYTAISGATTPTYDANGNMTTDETGRQFVYDAWNRLVTVKNSGGTTLETFGYDGMGHRVTQTASGTTTDLYYSAAWQVLEEIVSGAAIARYVWSPVYVDALVLRDRATGTPGTLNERLWVQQDANYNVTALVNGSGVVVERYAYDPYGAVTVLGGSYGSRGTSSYGWDVLWQGMRYDSVSGSYKSRERTDISPTLGRPFQPDPLRFGAGDVNFYRWEGNGPLNKLDPSGLEPPVFDPKQGLNANRPEPTAAGGSGAEFRQKSGLEDIVNFDVDVGVKETITDYKPGWNGTYRWNSKFSVSFNKNSCTMTITVRVKLSKAVDAKVQAAWKQAIENKWSDTVKLDCPCLGRCKGGVKLLVKLEFVDKGEHYVVTPNLPGVGGTHGPRA